MNYDLAKKLKNSGFPQRYWGDVYSEEKGHELMCIPQRLMTVGSGINIGETIACPTLSELIWACGDGFWSLEYNMTSRGYPFWRCGVRLPLVKMTEGDTPEEAVARLWLSLNKS